MAIHTKNFVFGDDFLEKSLSDFKAYMKERHKVGAKIAKQIYNEIHGDDTTVQPEVYEDSEQ